MSITLESHSRGYDITLNEAFYSVVNGLSGLPYGVRHLDMSEECTTPLAWGHRVIAVIELIPILGGLAALIERVAFFVYQHCFKPEVKSRSWHPRALSLDTTLEKMWKNARKAIVEHNKGDPAFASLEEALPELSTMLSVKPAPLSFAFEEAEACGRRYTMEDFHFFQEIEQGALAGVFDGHGGQRVADYACDAFTKVFSATLKRVNGNVHSAFEELIHAIHQEVEALAEFNSIGSTAVISFIEKETHIIYTATLGDSEANIYRKNQEGQLTSIPLSCVRNWGSVKDAQRVAFIFNRPEIVDEWTTAENPKLLRFPHPAIGVNVSRALGDKDYRNTEEKPGVIHKPKITMNQMKPGDRLILSCDGLKDFVTEQEIIEQLAREGDTAQGLIDYAINEKNSLDNVTVVIVHVG